MNDKHAERLKMEAENRERRQQKAHEHRERKARKEREWEEVRSIAWDAFRDSQPGGQLPDWIKMNANCSSGHAQDGIAHATISIWKRQVYPPEYSWEVGPGGHRLLTRTDPETGEKRFVISYTPPKEDLVILFRCAVAFPSKQVTVLMTTDTKGLESGEFELEWE